MLTYINPVSANVMMLRKQAVKQSLWSKTGNHANLLQVCKTKTTQSCCKYCDGIYAQCFNFHEEV